MTFLLTLWPKWKKSSVRTSADRVRHTKNVCFFSPYWGEKNQLSCWKKKAYLLYVCGNERLRGKRRRNRFLLSVGSLSTHSTLPVLGCIWIFPGHRTLNTPNSLGEKQTTRDWENQWGKNICLAVDFKSYQVWIINEIQWGPNKEGESEGLV